MEHSEQQGDSSDETIREQTHDTSSASDDHWEHDSGIGSATPLSSTTTSLTPSILDFKTENGRRYHAYREGTYYLPNDDKEADRLDLQHHVWRMTLDGALYVAPIPKTLGAALDLGCGTGIWAIEFAEEHPSATVIGVDLSPIQPAWVPPNCRL
jgi:SAM-dependent methyltransferase